MKVYKDKEHCVSIAPFALRGARRLMVSVGLYAVFEPEGGNAGRAPGDEREAGRAGPQDSGPLSGKAVCSLRDEQEFWKAAPDAFAALGAAPVMDLNLPKTGAEVLVAGFCRSPQGRAVTAREVFFRVGRARRRLAVFGDRRHLPGGGVSEPAPFSAMPLIWERAFGGPGHAANPQGKGLTADGAASEHLPNLEDPGRLIVSRHDRPGPACPFPVDLANEERRALSGTYDQRWLETRWPYYPDDLNPDFFFSAQPAQRLPMESAFFRGDEEVEMRGMHHERQIISSRLPGLRVRAFVTVNPDFAAFAPEPDEAPHALAHGAAPARGHEPATPGARINGHGSTTRPTAPRPLPYAKDPGLEGRFMETEMRLDTVWLLPDLCGAFMIYRGLFPVVDDEMDDVLRVFVVSEKLEDAPKDAAFYLEEQKKRVNPAVETDLAPLAQARDKITRAIKKARDLPKFFEKARRKLAGREPAMPFNMADMAHAASKTLAGARAALDDLEKQYLRQREEFSHLLSFDPSIFSKMRAALDDKEKKAAALFKKGETAWKLAEKRMAAAQALLAQRHAALARANPGLKLPPLELLRDKLEALSPQNLLARPQPINPWHDRGFALLVETRRKLERHVGAADFLSALGFEPGAIKDAWLGACPMALDDAPENWGLPPGPVFTLPPGIYVPRFADKTLVALRVYPLPAEKETRLFAPTEVFTVPGSEAAPLSLPPARQSGARLLVDDELAALLAEQEVGDFCRIIAAASPQDLAALKEPPAEKAPPEAGEAPAERKSCPAAGPPVKDEPPQAKEPPAPENEIMAVILPAGAQGAAKLKMWRDAYPEIAAVILPDGCPHIFALAAEGHRLRRLILDALPAAMAAPHDFDMPIPEKGQAPKPFALNLPLPGAKEISGHVEKLLGEVRAGFTAMGKSKADEVEKRKAMLLEHLKNKRVPPEAAAGIEQTLKNLSQAGYFAPTRPESSPQPPPAAEVMDKARKGLEALRANAAKAMPGLTPEILDKAEKKLAALEKRLLKIEASGLEGMKKIEDAKAMFAKGDLPEDIKKAFANKKIDPDALKKPSREQVIAWLAEKRSLARKNLMGLDLSGLDFSGADLSHTLCSRAIFRNCRMDGADFTFTIADGADFSQALLRGAHFTQSVLQKAVLRGADLSDSRWRLSSLGEGDCAGAVFDQAEISLTVFDKTALRAASFKNARISLSSFMESDCANADFSAARLRKCLMRQTSLTGALFRETALNETLLQGVCAPGLVLAGADLRKLYMDMECDFSGADFSGADLREASLRMSRLPGAVFCRALLEGALFAQCDLRAADLRGANGVTCRFLKCDLARADLSGANLLDGSLRKCRLTGADLRESNLHCVDLRDIIISLPQSDGAGREKTENATLFAGANLKRTVLHGRVKGAAS